MGIYQKGKDYFIDYRVNGRRKREKIGPSKKLAENVLRKKKLEIAENRFLDVRREKKVLFDDIAQEYLKFSKATKRSHERDITNFKHLLPVFGGRYLDEIDSLMVEQYKAERKEKVSVASVNRELAVLKHMFNKAIEWGKADKNPVVKVKLFRERNGRIRYLSLEEIEALLKSCNPPLLAIVFTALNTGMRRGEILNLKWEDLDLAQRILYVRDSKNAEQRSIPLNEPLLNVLQAIPHNGCSPYVFCRSEGEAIRSVRKAFHLTLKRAGIMDFRFHDLRHTFASHLVMSGVDLTTVKELLGHKTITMTLRYAHLSPDHKVKAVELLGARTGKSLDFQAGD